MGRHRYLVALGSNRRHPRHGSPRGVLAAALKRLNRGPFTVLTASRIMETAPLGPSARRYANAAAVVRCKRDPDEVLGLLQAIERKFGRKRRGQPWSARVLDLDIVLWNGGPWASAGDHGSLVIPHPSFRTRMFVLGPAASIAGAWRDPLTGFTLKQLTARLTKPRPAPR